MFLDQLNPSQREAVEYIDGASLVIAGAGSGKTRVLTYKIAYLLTMGYKPWQIMALTFTNKAANEMKERIISLVGEQAKGLQMGTFHSVFARILRREADALPHSSDGNHYTSNFTIYDESDSRSLCKIIVKQLGLDDKTYKPADVHNRISWAKNKLLTPEDYALDSRATARDMDAKMPEMANIYTLYVQHCMKSNAMDFDDLLVQTFILFNNNPELRQKYSENYRFLLVDEYQDTNYAQQKIVWQLAGIHKHVCVVGDDAQSIYGFRGADIDNILDFQQQYEGSRMFKLEQNYRSTQRIVQAANSLIRHNDRQIPKDVYSHKDQGSKLTLRMLSSDREEALNICREIKKQSSKYNYSDFAVLYRTNFQSRTFEDQMRKDNIPYHIVGGLSFYQRKEIKDVIAYFRLVVNPHDEEAFRRIVNYPARGLGDTTINKLIAAASAYHVSMWTVCKDPSAYGLNINKGTTGKLNAFCTLITDFASRLFTDDAFTLGHEIIKKSGISLDVYSGTEPDDISRQENLEEFVSSLQDFVEGNREQGLPTGLNDFLQEVSLLSDKESEGDGEDENNKVTLMTIHAAKGLEFPVVFIVGLEENIFPSPMSIDSKRKLEEERRLLYVAITRAEEQCFLTCAKNRYRFGRMEFDAPSRFLKDIDTSFLTIENAAEDAKYSSARGGNGYGYGGYGSKYGSLRMQNSNPVASQFMADPKPRITTPRHNETPVNPYGENFEKLIAAHGGNLKRVHSSLATGTNRSNMYNGSNVAPDTPASQSTYNGLTVGMKVKHTRFGAGTITALEGSGDSAKAHVQFQNAGNKQLLLKYAKLEQI